MTTSRKHNYGLNHSTPLGRTGIGVVMDSPAGRPGGSFTFKLKPWSWKWNEGEQLRDLMPWSVPDWMQS
jgi:hypothetical protein